MDSNNIAGDNLSAQDQQKYYNILENAHDEFATIDLFGHPAQIQTEQVDSRGRRSNALPFTQKSTVSGNIIKTVTTTHALALGGATGAGGVGVVAPLVWPLNNAQVFRKINKNQKKQVSLSYLNYLI